ncbi:MAG: hypothetical protein RH946_11785 [Rhodospirillales bacterium]
MKNLFSRFTDKRNHPVSRGAESPGKTKSPRSVLFLHQSYYQHYMLAAALRRRGWDAIQVSMEAPNSNDSWLYHGEDLNLYDPDPKAFRANVDRFFKEALERFDIVHFASNGYMAFHPEDFDNSMYRDRVPWDFIRLRERGVRIAFTTGGCYDGILQSSIARWTGGACNKCSYQNQPEICSDVKNAAWGAKILTYCDLISGEMVPTLDFLTSPKVCREPLTTALDDKFFSPDIEVPHQYDLRKSEGELIVFHAMANASRRDMRGESIKGSRFVIEAVERLKSEGMNVRLVYSTDVPSKDMRYIIVQADVVVDQLNLGWYGATGREAMMLGRPLICKVQLPGPEEPDRLSCLDECPAISATEDSIYAALKDILCSPGRRDELSMESRAYAQKWHSADACAARYEKIWDLVAAGVSPRQAGMSIGASYEASKSE